MVVLNYSDGYEPGRCTGRNADWYAVAQGLNGAFIPDSFLRPRQMFLQSEGRSITLTDSSDESQRGVVARTTFCHHRALWLTLYLYPRRMDHFLDRILSWPGCRLTHRVRIDDVAFDRHGFLRCSDAGMAVRLFEDDSFRSMVLNESPGWLRISPRKRDDRISQLAFYRHGARITDEDLVGIYNTTAATLKRLIAIGWAETGAPNPA